MDNENELKKREVLRLSNEESHKLTIECIRSALIYLMNKKEYEKITITEIIKRSGVSRAAFYRNYSSKDEVLQEAMEEIRNVLKEAFANSLLDDDPKEWLIQFFDEIQKNKSEIKQLLNANLDYKMIFDDFEFETKDEAPLNKYKMAMYISSLWVVVKLWQENNFCETSEELANLMLDVFINHCHRR